MPLKNKEKQKEYVKTYYNKNKDKYREKQYRRLYGMSLQDYNTLFLEQGGKCKICKTHQTEFNKSLHVDHCHKTNRIRGLLCNRCNLVLGKAEDNIELLKEHIKYLESFL